MGWLKRDPCRWRRHKLPRRIGPEHPAITVTGRVSDRSAGGRAGAITCPRCGRTLGPFDDGYPMIDPTPGFHSGDRP